MNNVPRKSRLLLMLSILMALTLVFAACDTGATEPTIVDEPAVVDEPLVEDPVVVEEPVVTEEVVVVEEPVVTEEAVVVEEPVVEDTGAVAVEEGEGVAPVQDIMVDASFLLGVDVDNIQDEDLGSIDDLLIDTSTGNIPYAIMESTGFLGFGGEDVLIPFSAFELGENGNEMILPFVTPEDIEGAPTVQDDTWPTFGDPAWDDQSFGFWSGTELGQNLVDFDETTPVLRASSLVGIGAGAFGDVGAGNVNSLLVDLGNDQAKWIVLDYGTTGVATYTDNLVLVPFTAMDWTVVGDEIAFNPNLDPAVLSGAPMILREDFANAEFLTSDFDTEIVDYWEGQGYPVSGP